MCSPYLNSCFDYLREFGIKNALKLLPTLLNDAGSA